jgi:hypothetical protein
MNKDINGKIISSKNGYRMETTIELYSKNPLVTRSEIIQEIRIRTNDCISEDTAGCVRTTLSLLNNNLIAIKGNNVITPTIDAKLLKKANSLSKLVLGWLVTLEALRRGKDKNDDVRETAIELGYDYEPSDKPCIPAGVKDLFNRGIIK